MKSKCDHSQENELGLFIVDNGDAYIICFSCDSYIEISKKEGIELTKVIDKYENMVLLQDKLYKKYLRLLQKGETI